MDSSFDKRYDRLEGIWKHASAKKQTLMYLYVYTFCFFIAFLIAFSPYIIEGKTLIWGLGMAGDGRNQHLPAMIYIGQYLYEFIMNLAHGEISFPLFDLGINMGGDIIGTLHGNIDTDPLYILSALVPTAYSEYLYCFLAVLRLYLAGLSFSCLCFYHGKRVPHTLAGSLIYCFSSYACLNVARHVYFLTPMILLPLLLVGIDKILKNKAPWVFIISLCYAAISCGYYCLYQMTIMLFIYAVVRFFDIYKTHRAKQFAFAAWRGAIAYAIGTGLSAFILLPSVLNLLASFRSGFSSWIALTRYSYPYIASHIIRLIVPTSGFGWAYLGLAAIVYFAIAMLLCAHGKRTLKILLCIGIFFWLDNIGNYIMHGFQYPIGRWMYGFVLLLSYITVDILPELTRASAKQKCVCAIALFVYMIMALLRPRERQLEYVLVGLTFLSLTLWVLSLRLGENKEKFPKYCSLLCIVLVIVNVGVNGIYRSAPDQGNYVAEFSPWGKEIDYLFQSAELAIKPLLGEAPQGRADGSEFSGKLVSEWLVPKMTFYDSLAAAGVIEFWSSMEMRRELQWPQYSSTQQCTIINTLLSGKYHIEPENNRSYVPYGYEFISHAKGKRSIYENTYALPWGYTYEKAVSYEEMNNLNGLQKQEAMLQAVALDNAPQKSASSLAFDAQEVPYKAVYENCTYKGNILTVKEQNANIRLFFSLPSGAEGYVRLSGLEIQPAEFTVSVKCGDVIRKSCVKSKKNNYYNGERTYLFNLGYSNEERRELTITFPHEGKFILDDIKLYALPMGNYPKRVEALRAEPLENIQWGVNKFTGTVDLSKDKILCVSVPYTKGWSATVDGKKAEILRGNYMFMCLPLTAGHHNIEFNYCSPGLKLGAVITLCSACIVLGMLFISRKRNRGRNNTEERSMHPES